MPNPAQAGLRLYPQRSIHGESRSGLARSASPAAACASRVRTHASAVRTTSMWQLVLTRPKSGPPVWKLVGRMAAPPACRASRTPQDPGSGRLEPASGTPAQRAEIVSTGESEGIGLGLVFPKRSFAGCVDRVDVLQSRSRRPGRRGIGSPCAWVGCERLALQRSQSSQAVRHQRITGSQSLCFF